MWSDSSDDTLIQSCIEVESRFTQQQPEQECIKTDVSSQKSAEYSSAHQGHDKEKCLDSIVDSQDKLLDIEHSTRRQDEETKPADIEHITSSKYKETKQTEREHSSTSQDEETKPTKSEHSTHRQDEETQPTDSEHSTQRHNDETKQADIHSGDGPTAVMTASDKLDAATVETNMTFQSNEKEKEDGTNSNENMVQGNQNTDFGNTSPETPARVQGTDTNRDKNESGIKPLRRNKRRKTQTHKKLAYISSSSSDDNIPLSMYIAKGKFLSLNLDDSDGDQTFVPASKDLNSTDSEFHSDVSDNTRQDIAFKETVKKVSAKSKQGKCKPKEKHYTRKQRKELLKSSASPISELQRAKAISSVQAIVQNSIIKAKEGRLDQVLYSNGLRRITVPRHGNCFFDACLYSGKIRGTSWELRQSLCQHLEQNCEEYVGFLLNTYSPVDEESFVLAYMEEIEKLKEEGYWSNKVADFLPLALANQTKCTVKIFTSKIEQPVIIVQPSLVPSQTSEEISIAYISAPNVLEHYDACEPGRTAVDEMSNTGTQNSCDYSNVSTTPSPGIDDDVLLANPASSTASSRPMSSTPRKKAVFTTPLKRKLSRKRKATPENWKRNIRKKLKLGGQEYLSATGKKIPKKAISLCDCSRCRYKCNQKCSEEERNSIFLSFWAMESYERQKDFICSRVKEKKTKTVLDENQEKVPKKKKVARTYSFEISGSVFQVCKKFFLATLGVDDAYVVHALSNKVAGHFEGNERRGKCPSANKISPNMLERVRNHIKSFPTVAGHYTRKDSKREYLETILTIPKMYELYKELCQKNEQTPVKLSMYRRIFNEEFNLSFHVPKKDQCNMCSKYRTAEQDGVLTDRLKEEFNQHQQRKVRAREEKAKDKQLAKTESNVHTCTFDLQAVLYTPCSLVSVMYYMRKLCCYNLSVYSLGNGDGSCYLWSEVNGKRGSSEIATCIHRYLKALPPTIQHVILYSDSCTGQNRNQIMATSLVHAVQQIENIKIIDHKFLESGHTHMECDSMHAAIEFAKKKTQINVPSQWDTVITMARRNKPYNVIPLRFTDFIDFHKLKSQNHRVGNTDSGVKVNWTIMKWMRFSKSDPGSCFFKYDMNNTDFERIVLSCKEQTSSDHLPARYKAKIPISSAKKRDLITLCKKGTVPREFHEYYRSLPVCQSAKEKLPEPDMNESEIDTADE